MVAQHRRSAPADRAAGQDRRHPRAAAGRPRARPSTPTPGRCTLDPDQRRRDRPPRSPGRGDGEVAGAGGGVRGRAAPTSTTAGCRSRRCCGWPASTRRRPRETDKAIAAYRKVVEIEPDRREGLAGAGSPVHPQPSSWPELAEVLRGEIRLANSDEEIIALQLPAGPAAGAGARRSAQGGGGLPGHPERQPQPPRDARRAGAAAHERAHAARGRPRCWSRSTALGEEWEKLRRRLQAGAGAADRPRGAAEPAAAAGRHRREPAVRSGAGLRVVVARRCWRIPRSEQALDELLRLARVTHQWDGYVGTMLRGGPAARRADAAPGRAHAPGRGVRDRPRRPGAGRGGAAPGAGRAARGRRGAGLPRSDLRPAGDLRSAGRGAAAAHRHHRRLRGAGRRCTCASGGCWPTCWTTRRGHRQLPGGAGAGHPQRRGAGGAGAALLPRRALGGAVRRLREDARHRPGRRGAWPTATRAWRASAREAFDDREQGGRACGARCWTCAGRTRWRLAALADLHEQAGEWRELTEVLDNQIRATADAAGPHPALQAPRAHLGREAVSASATRSSAWQQVLEIDPNDVEALRAIADNYRTPGAWEELSDTLQRLIDSGAEVLGDDGAQGAVLAAG